MHFSPNQRRILFLLAVLWLLLAVPRLPAVVQAQAGACSTGLSFTAAREYYAGRLATTIASGDFNGDGVPDLAVATVAEQGSGSRLSILLGDGQGGLAKLVEYPVNETPKDLLVGDFNGDSKPDVVLSNAIVYSDTLPRGFKAGIAVMLGVGDGTFGAGTIYEVVSAGALASADFNGDGKPDVATVDGAGGNLNIVLGAGDGSFAAPVSYKTGTSILPIPVGVAAADFNQDGKADVVVANQNEGDVAVFLNDGKGGFGAPTLIPVRAANRLVVGDFSGDGQLDIAVGSNSELGFLRGTGAGGFAAPTNLFLPTAYINNNLPGALIKGDFNADGKLDLAFAGGPGITVMLADGAGGYTLRSYGAGRFGVALVAADFNRDGKLDLAGTKADFDSVTMLLNAGAAEFRGMKAARFGYGVPGFSVADLNSDGKLDLVVQESDKLYTGLGNGAGEFGTVTTFDSSHQLYNAIAATAIADFTGEGNADVAVLNPDRTNFSNSVVTLLPDVGVATTNTTAYYNRIKTYRVGTRAADLVAADFNGDKRPDLAVANAGSDDVAILLNNGRGGFANTVTIGVGLDPRSLAAADFNGDGKLDLAVACRNTAGVFLLLGDGTGGFTVNGIGIGANPRSVVTGDFNRDGKADLAVSHSNSMYLSILLGNGQGGFAAPLTVDVGGRPFDFVSADFTGDNILDIAVTRSVLSFGSLVLDDRVFLLAGDGTGKFARLTELAVTSASHLRGADLNSDGLMDLAIASTSNSGGQVWLAFNSCNPPAAANAAVTVNAASYAGVAAAPEAIVSAFGTALSNGTFNAPGLPLPTKLGDTEITVKDSKGVERAAPLFFVSPFQVNYLIPAGTAAGIATVTIRNGTEKTSTGTVLILPTAPGLFAANANGEGVAAAQVFRLKFPSNAESYEAVAQFDSVLKKFVPLPIDTGTGIFPAQDKIYLLLFGTGLRSRAGLDAVRVKIGNAELPVEYAGPQPQYMGLDQVNVLISGVRAVGEVEVTVIVDGKASNAVRVNIQ